MIGVGAPFLPPLVAPVVDGIGGLNTFLLLFIIPAVVGVGTLVMVRIASSAHDHRWEALDLTFDDDDRTAQEAEVRDFVRTRNERRRERGQSPLDEESEVRRLLAAGSNEEITGEEIERRMRELGA